MRGTNRARVTVSTAAAVLVLVSFASLSADTKVKVTFHSDPIGANIYEDGRYWGAAPFTLEYRFKTFRACQPLRPLLVRWVSGAEVKLDGLQVCPEQGKQQQFSVFRPTGAPGVELDAQYAIEVLRGRGAAPAVFSAVARMPRPLICTTTVIGQQVFTTCL